MRTYGQYCPIARGAEIFAERWTPLIVRNLYLGCGSFSEILEGAPGLSRTLLSQRLKRLERLGVVESSAKSDGRGHHYELTAAGHDLFTVALDEPAYLGKDRELFAAWRLDNLTSTHAGIAALIAAEDTGGTVPVLASFNYEEIGSMTYSGAQSPFLETVLRRLLADDFEAYARTIAASAMMSSDTGNAVHPNYQEKHEPGHRPIPGGGPMLKVSANQRYASGAEEQALFRRAADAAGIPWQTYVNRNDIPGGTTIGPISGTQLGILTVDVGLPILSMHSARELCGAEDPGLLADLALGLFTH